MREFEKKTITVYDLVRGRDRTFKEGDRVKYVGHFFGVIQSDFSVKLDDGRVLQNVIHNQPHKIVTI